MRRWIALLLLAGCGGKGELALPLPEEARPQLALEFEDEVPYHTVGIAFDGRRFYTVNGGNEEHGVVNVYDTSGKLLETWKVKVDARTIWFNPKTKKLYVKDYFRDLWELDPKTGKLRLFKESAFHDCQSSPGLSPDGKRVYERVDSLVFVMEWGTFRDLDTIRISDQDDFPANVAVAAGPGALFTFDGETLRVWSLEGQLKGSYALPKGSYPFSLSWAGRWLFVADDADGGSVGAKGVWYGYRFVR